METFIGLIQPSIAQDKENEVKVKGKNVIIPAEKIVQINCKINMGLMEKQRATIFQQRDVELPEGIHCADSVVLLKLLVSKTVFEFMLSMTPTMILQ